MTICGSQSCACALRSDSLSISGSGTPGSPWVIEQAEFEDIVALQNAVDNLEAQMATALADVSALQTLTAAHTAAITRIDGMQAGFVSVSSGTTSGTTALTLDTGTLTTLADAGVIFLFSAIQFTKTVSSDVFGLSTRVNSTATAVPSRDYAGAANGSMTTIGGPSSVSAATTPTVDFQIVRVSGTGTATVVNGVLRWLFLPN